MKLGMIADIIGQNTQHLGTRRQTPKYKTLGIIILAASEPVLSIVYAPIVNYSITQSVEGQK